MNRASLFSGALVLMAAGWLGCASTQTPPIDPASRLPSGEPAPRPSHHFDRVLTIVLENQDYADAIGDPYLFDLARRGTSFTNFHGLYHPSYANYLAMVSGRLIDTPKDRQIQVDLPTIGDRLEGRGLSWKNYAEGYPGDCFLAAKSRPGRYARKHVPFLSFLRVQKENCGHVVPASQFAADLGNQALPAYAFYSPDLDHDGHDPVLDPPRGLAKASSWLQTFLEPLLADDDFSRETLVIVTFDESKGSNPANNIYTVFLGDMVKPDVKVEASVNHFNVLRTIEDNFGLAPLNDTARDGDGGARSITGVWK